MEKKKPSAYVTQPSSMFNVTEVTSVNTVIMLLEMCISFLNLVMHPLSELLALLWMLNSSVS